MSNNQSNNQNNQSNNQSNNHQIIQAYLICWCRGFWCSSVSRDPHDWTSWPGRLPLARENQTEADSEWLGHWTASLTRRRLRPVTSQASQKLRNARISILMSIFMPISQSLDATMVLINSKWREEFLASSSSTSHLENMILLIFWATYFEISMLSSNEEKSKISSRMLHHAFSIQFIWRRT